MFDKAHHMSLPNYYQIRTSSRSTLLSVWRTLYPNTNVFYVTVSHQLINQSYSEYDSYRIEKKKKKKIFDIFYKNNYPDLFLSKIIIVKDIERK
jgi:hypothetical protein